MCGRNPSLLTRHHLIPRKRHRANETRKRFSSEQMRQKIVLLCRPCHKTVHAHLTEKELARDYHTLDALKAHPEVARFVRWVRKQSADAHIVVRRPTRRE